MHRSQKNTRTWFYSIVFALSCAARAEDASSDLTTVPFEKLLQTEVITASRLAKQVSDSPSAVVIVTSDDIRTYGYRTLADVINSMRGLYTTSDRRYAYLGGRGFGSPGDYTGRIMLLIDGNVSQDNIYNQAFIDNSGLLDMELIDRVEYVPGTGSVTYGNNALLGIINVITKKGEDFDSAQASVERFSFGGEKTRFTVGKKLDNGYSFLVSASHLHSDGQNLYFPYFAAIGEHGGQESGQDYETADRYFAKLDHDGLTIETAGVWRTKASPLPKKEGAFDLPYAVNDVSKSSSLTYDMDLGKNLKSSSHLYYGLYEDRALREYGTPDPIEQYRKNRNKGQWWGVDQKFVSTAFHDHILVFGGEFRNDFQQRLSSAALAPDQHISFLYDDSPFNNKTYSLYGTDEYTVNSVLTTNIGIRLDKPDARDCSLTPCDVYAHKAAWSPRAAFTLALDDVTTLKGSFSKAFRIPNASEVSGPTDDNLLRPEHVDATEFVLQRELSPTSRVVGSVYHDVLTDQYYVSSTSGTGVYNGASKANGLEMQYDNIWDDGMQLRSSVALQHATDPEGKRLVNSPRVLAKLNLGLPVLAHAAQMGFETQYMGPRPAMPITDDNNIVIREGRSVGGATLFNWTLSSTRSWNGLSASFSVKNVFDHRYEVPAATVRVADNGAVLDTIQMDGRSFWLQLNYAFWR